MDVVIQKYINNFSKKEDVIGILVFGSYVRGGIDKFSDIDLYVLLSNKPKYCRVGEKSRGLLFDIQLDEKKEAYKFLQEEKCQVKRNFSHMLAFDKVVYDTRGEMKKLQQAAQKNLTLKTKLSRQEKIMHLYSINDFYGEAQRYAKTADVLAFRQNCELLVNNIIELFLKLKGEYFRRPNEMLAVLDKCDPNFAKLIDSYYLETSNTKILNKLNLLVKYIYNIAGGKLPQKWHV